jgi:peptidoglycan/LPS O-acetylase OafA/YrhL
LAVILLHLNIHFGFTNTFLKEVLPQKLFSLLFWSGYYGVVIFFTLSGYLITSSILNKWDALYKIDLKTFYWLRFSRIIPLLLTLLILLCILHLTGVEGFIIDPKQTSLARAFLAALTFHINWLEIQVGYLPPNWDILWSISIEEMFYLIFPLLCLFLKNELHFASVLILFLIISPWARINLYTGNELADKNHLAYIDSLALGCMSAIITARFAFPKWLNQVFLWIGCSMVTLVVYFRGFVYQSGLVGLGVNVTILSVGVALILLWLHYNHHSGNEKDRLIFRWLKLMGIYSYEIYLTHMFVVLLGAKVFKYFELGPDSLIIFSVLIILISYLLSNVVFNNVSEPLNIWLRKKWARK